MFSDVQYTTLAAMATGIVMTSGVLWSLTKPPSQILIKDADYQCQSVLVDPKTLTRTSQFEPLVELRRGNVRNIETLYDAFQCGLNHGKNEPCLGYKDAVSGKYEYVTYEEVDRHSVNTGAGIIHRLKQPPGQNTKIGIFMKNCVEWVYIEQSCSRYSTVPVPLYDTLGEESCIHIINQVKCQIIFVDNQKKTNFLLEQRSQLPSLKYVVCVHTLEKAIVEKGRQCNIDFVHFSEILKSGQEHPHALLLSKPEDISTIFFTSGTTGDPKGCVLSHTSVMWTIKCFISAMKQSNFGKKKEVHFSFLPLTHVYERLVHVLIFIYTGKIVFFSGDMRYLIDEMKVVKPTILSAVPRILNRVYDKVQYQINKSKIARLIYDRGFSSKMEEVRRGVIRKNSIWDFILFRKIQASLGGNVDIFLIASAPTSPHVVDFCRVVMGSLLIEGYGQTETSGAITFTLLGDYIADQVGPPVPGVLIKFVDVPELNIIVSRDFKGEICVKGPSCIKEYYNNKEMTAKLIDCDGWVHTGDVGQWTEKGQLKIVDRCKHLFKLAQGEYLAPEKLENVYTSSDLVSQVFVTGNSLKDYCVAIVIPELEGWQILDKKYNSVQDICDNKDSVQIVLKNLEVVGKANKLMGFEIVKKVCLWPQQMTMKNNLLTPTMKIKRAEVSKFFEMQIQELYSV